MQGTEQMRRLQEENAQLRSELEGHHKQLVDMIETVQQGYLTRITSASAEAGSANAASQRGHPGRDVEAATAFEVRFCRADMLWRATVFCLNHDCAVLSSLLPDQRQAGVNEDFLKAARPAATISTQMHHTCASTCATAQCRIRVCRKTTTPQ